MKKVFRILGRFLKRKNFYLIKGLEYLGREQVIEVNSLDFVRVATLELIADEIKLNSIEGAVAELGVYQGGFAKYINQVFPDRPLYLFDTFSGFDEADIRKEIKFGSEFQNFSKTSIEKVLKKMKYPNKCIIKEGYFPATIVGLEQTEFCFVSIDADLYEPTIKGLEFFYNNLVEGGFIMVHDYNNVHYKGCKKAIQEFTQLNKIAFVPLPDIGGTAVIKKA